MAKRGPKPKSAKAFAVHQWMKHKLDKTVQKEQVTASKKTGASSRTPKKKKEALQCPANETSPVNFGFAAFGSEWEQWAKEEDMHHNETTTGRTKLQTGKGVEDRLRNQVLREVQTSVERKTKNNRDHTTVTHDCHNETANERKRRLAQEHKLKETHERREQDRKRKRSRRDQMNTVEKEDLREQDRKRKASRRDQMNTAEKKNLREEGREREASRRDQMNTAEKKNLREEGREREASRRDQMNTAEKKNLREVDREWKASRRDHMNTAEKKNLRDEGRKREATRRDQMSTAEKEDLHQQGREREMWRRNEQSSTAKKRRLSGDRQRHRHSWVKLSESKKEKKIKEVKKRRDDKNDNQSSTARKRKREAETADRDARRRSQSVKRSLDFDKPRVVKTIDELDDTDDDNDAGITAKELTKLLHSDPLNEFHASMWTLTNSECPNCCEKSLLIKLKTTKGRTLCQRCHKLFANLHRTEKEFTKDNNMDPGPMPSELADLNLTPYEEILIAKNVSMFSIYRLPLGQLSYRGNVINIPQDVQYVADILPRTKDETGVLVLRAYGESGTHKDFRVRRDRVRKALVWLKANHKGYANIQISDDRLDALPENDFVDVNVMEVDGPVAGKSSFKADGPAADDCVDSPDETVNARKEVPEEPARAPGELLLESITPKLAENHAEQAKKIPEATSASTSRPDHEPGLESEKMPIECSASDVEENKTENTGQMMKSAASIHLDEETAHPSDEALPECFIPNIDQSKTEQARKIQDANSALSSRPEQVHDWPPRKTHQPIDEFNAVGYVVDCFPLLFPWGEADLNADRPLSPRGAITTQMYFQHLINYRDGRFARHSRFRYFALNTILRHRAMASGRVFVKNNKDVADLSIEELQDMNRQDQKKLLRNISRYSTSFQGTPAFWGEKRKELLAMIKQKNTLPTVFFTYSSADTHWPDLHRFMPGYSSKITAVNENPLLCDTFFYLRVDKLLTFMKKKFKMIDYWGRFEYQSRGSAHFHGVAWFQDAPDIKNLIKNQNDLQKQGAVKYFDDLLTATNPCLNADGSGVMPNITPNPASVPYFKVTKVFKDQDTAYKGLVMHVHRHKCRVGYCQKKIKGVVQPCRFGFPKDLVPETTLETKKDAKGRETVELNLKRNDPWVNSHIQAATEANRGNCDAQAVADEGGIVGYIAKYISKPEVQEAAIGYVLGLIAKSALPLAYPVRSLAQRALIRIVSERDYSAQETMHLIMSLKLVLSSRTFMPLVLEGSHEVRKNDDGESIILSNAVENYCERPASMSNMSLMQLYRTHRWDGNTFTRRKDIHKKETEAIVVPKGFKNVPKESPLYREYCRKYLMLHTPFRSVDQLKDPEESFEQAYEDFVKNRDSADAFYEDIEDRVDAQEQVVDSGDEELDGQPEKMMMDYDMLMTINPKFKEIGDIDRGHDWSASYREDPAKYDQLTSFHQQLRDHRDVHDAPDDVSSCVEP